MYVYIYMHTYKHINICKYRDNGVGALDTAIKRTSTSMLSAALRKHHANFFLLLHAPHKYMYVDVDVCI